MVGLPDLRPAEFLVVAEEEPAGRTEWASRREPASLAVWASLLELAGLGGLVGLEMWASRRELAGLVVLDGAIALALLPAAAGGRATEEAAGVEFSLSEYSGVLDEEMFLTAAVSVSFPDTGGLPDPLVPCRTKK